MHNNCVWLGRECVHLHANATMKEGEEKCELLFVATRSKLPALAGNAWLINKSFSQLYAPSLSSGFLLLFQILLHR